MNKGSKLKNAILYAASLYEGAEECKTLNETHSDAENLQAVMAADGAKDFALLNNPIWPLQAKTDIAAAIADKLKLSKPTANLLKILVENRRIDELGLILEQFKEYYNKKQNIADVEVETVTELSAAQDKKLKQKLSALFNKDVAVNYHLNPQILGGLIIRCGTVLIDSSVKHRLDSLEQLMKGTK